MGNLFGRTPAAPSLPPVQRMPSPGDTELREARQLQMQATRKREGRRSTILSDVLSQNVNGSVGALGA
jgi:hypothetical protein